VSARAGLLAAEALVETGQFSLAVPLLADPAAAQLPRWEWVTHRWLALQAGRRLVSADPTAKGTLGGSRIRRLTAFWKAEAAAGARRSAPGLRRRARRAVRAPVRRRASGFGPDSRRAPSGAQS